MENSRGLWGERRSLPDAGCFSFIRFQGEDLSREDLNRENLNRNGQDGRIWLIIRTQKENIVSQNEE